MDYEILFIMAFGDHAKDFPWINIMIQLEVLCFFFYSSNLPWRNPLQITGSRKATRISDGVSLFSTGLWERTCGLCKKPHKTVSPVQEEEERVSGPQEESSNHILVTHNLLLFMPNQKMEAQWLRIWPRSTRTVAPDETRTCFVQYEPLPAVVSVPLSLATLFAATLGNNVFTFLVEDFS